jgi:hypothetical protein
MPFCRPICAPPNEAGASPTTEKVEPFSATVSFGARGSSRPQDRHNGSLTTTTGGAAG